MDETSVNLDAGGDDWLTTYSDAITLLMAFFVILLTMQEGKGAGPGEVQEPPTSPSTPASEMVSEVSAESVQKIEQELQVLRTEFDLDEKLRVTRVKDGLVIELADRTLFKSGQAKIKPKGLGILGGITEILHEIDVGQSYKIEIEGHTDDRPVKSRRIGSNWALSSRRATNVVQMLIQGGIPENQMRATAYAHTRPKLPNRTADGKPIRKNQALNRRVVIKLELPNTERMALSLLD